MGESGGRDVGGRYRKGDGGMGINKEVVRYKLHHIAHSPAIW